MKEWRRRRRESQTYVSAPPGRRIHQALSSSREPVVQYIAPPLRSHRAAVAQSRLIDRSRGGDGWMGGWMDR